MHERLGQRHLVERVVLDRATATDLPARGDPRAVDMDVARSKKASIARSAFCSPRRRPPKPATRIFVPNNGRRVISGSVPSGPHSLSAASAIGRTRRVSGRRRGSTYCAVAPWRTVLEVLLAEHADRAGGADVGTGWDLLLGVQCCLCLGEDPARFLFGVRASEHPPPRLARTSRRPEHHLVLRTAGPRRVQPDSPSPAAAAQSSRLALREQRGLLARRHRLPS